jgi:hypothetical protein
VRGARGRRRRGSRGSRRLGGRLDGRLRDRRLRDRRLRDRWLRAEPVDARQRMVERIRERNASRACKNGRRHDDGNENGHGQSPCVQMSMAHAECW